MTIKLIRDYYCAHRISTHMTRLVKAGTIRNRQKFVEVDIYVTFVLYIDRNNGNTMK